MKMIRALPAALLLCFGPAAAGSLDGDRYVAERYGRLEIAAPAGRWEIFDREGGIAADEGGPVVELQLRRAVAGLRPTLRITGVRKGDAAVSANSILRTSREAFVEAGGELGPILRRVHRRADAAVLRRPHRPGGPGRPQQGRAPGGTAGLLSAPDGRADRRLR